MEDEEDCKTALGLGLGMGVGEYVARPEPVKSPVCLDLSFTLYPKREALRILEAEVSSSKSVEEEDGEHANNNNNSNGAACLANNRNNCGRKKLRLNKEQSVVLEDSFKQHNTLNPTQKQALAEQLNLKPRQVEVWFQNRRARTKLKQTEVDCEFLKKCCESLSDENRRLKMELQELRSLKVGGAGRSLLCAHLPPEAATALPMCPCGKTAREAQQQH